MDGKERGSLYKMRIVQFRVVFFHQILKFQLAENSYPLSFMGMFKIQCTNLAIYGHLHMPMAALKIMAGQLSLMTFLTGFVTSEKLC